MTIRFAAAWGGSTSVIVRPITISVPLSAVNDNPVIAGVPARLTRSHRKRTDLSRDGRVLTDALRHFAVYGLSAASSARSHAVAAQSIGDEASRDHWLAICRKLDRRMADACERNLAISD